MYRKCTQNEHHFMRHATSVALAGMQEASRSDHATLLAKGLISVAVDEPQVAEGVNRALSVSAL
jgi:hypothetical protein